MIDMLWGEWTAGPGLQTTSYAVASSWQHVEDKGWMVGQWHPWVARRVTGSTDGPLCLDPA